MTKWLSIRDEFLIHQRRKGEHIRWPQPRLHTQIKTMTLAMIIFWIKKKHFWDGGGGTN
jgi:hypothetical protein